MARDDFISLSDIKSWGLVSLPWEIMWKQKRGGTLVFRSQAEESNSSKEIEKEQPVRKEKHLS